MEKIAALIIREDGVGMKTLSMTLADFILKNRILKIVFFATVLAAGALAVFYVGFFDVEAPSADIREYNKGVERLAAVYLGNNEEDLKAASRHFEKSAKESRDKRVKAASLYNLATSNVEYAIKDGNSVFKEIDLRIAELKEAARYNSRDEDIKFNLSLLLELKSIEPGNIYRELEKEGNPVPLPPASDSQDTDKKNGEEIKEKKDPGLKPGDLEIPPPF